jgi:hypothetical protein
MATLNGITAREDPECTCRANTCRGGGWKWGTQRGAWVPSQDEPTFRPDKCSSTREFVQSLSLSLWKDCIWSTMRQSLTEISTCSGLSGIVHVWPGPEVSSLLPWLARKLSRHERWHTGFYPRQAVMLGDALLAAPLQTWARSTLAVVLVITSGSVRLSADNILRNKISVGKRVDSAQLPTSQVPTQCAASDLTLKYRQHETHARFALRQSTQPLEVGLSRNSRTLRPPTNYTASRSRAIKKLTHASPSDKLHSLSN